MGISLKTQKILWSRSGGKCAICKASLIVDSPGTDEDPSIVGDIAHIIARSENFSRGDFDSLTPEERDSYSNLLLLCKNHHKQIDDQPEEFTVEKLRKIKSDHELAVSEKWTAQDQIRQQNDAIYAGYIDIWTDMTEINNWRNICSALSSDPPAISKAWYDKQREFIIWIIARIWPKQHPALEAALLNYKAVLLDYLNLFSEHINYDHPDETWLVTDKFYKIREWDHERYHKLLDQYVAHECLVNDLFFELTRAANYVCDKVRETIFPAYRIEDGVLLVVRYGVGYELATIHTRTEYRNDERTDFPYPGLDSFKEVRYTRDLALDPNPPPPPLG